MELSTQLGKKAATGPGRRGEKRGGGVLGGTDTIMLKTMGPEWRRAVLRRNEVEAGIGIEPMYRSFADSRLTTWLTRPKDKVTTDST